MTKVKHIMTLLMVFVSVGGILVLAIGRSSTPDTEPSEVCDLTFSNGLTLEAVPVAKTPAQRTQGLAHRDEAGPGMLFTWGSAAPRVFWMRDTRMPLSVGFFDAAGTLFAIKHMTPHTDTHHASGRPAQEALELAQGAFKALGLAPGVRRVERDCWASRQTL